MSVIDRYDLILHLVTAAKGAEKDYVLKHNNRENLEEARILDVKLEDCWRGHPYHRVIDNSTDFNGKLERVNEQILELVLRNRLL